MLVFSEGMLEQEWNFSIDCCCLKRITFGLNTFSTSSNVIDLLIVFSLFFILLKMLNFKSVSIRLRYMDIIPD